MCVYVLYVCFVCISFLFSCMNVCMSTCTCFCLYACVCTHNTPAFTTEVWAIICETHSAVDYRGMQQCYKISIYCNIYYSNAVQYGFKEISIYCNVCCLNVVNAQSLDHKNDWTSSNQITHLSFLRFYTVIQGLYSFLHCQNPYSHIECPVTKIQSNIAL